jgi:hypothetical protein
MLPFIFEEESSLPEEFALYWPLRKPCAVGDEERGKVGYLTVDERLVKQGESHRRPGLHCESPGFFSEIPKCVTYNPSFRAWGGGSARLDRRYGGLYIGSNVNDSCRIHDCSIKPEFIGSHGNIEHLKDFVVDKCGKRLQTKSHQLYWLTDSTPHESLPLKKESQRTFFRVVTSNVSVWYADHSTPNPKVKIPKEVKIIKGNKFELEKKI